MRPEDTALFKSKKFAIRIVRLYTRLRDVKMETVMSKQLLRCGTSIGANLSEAECAVSKKDFANKVGIANKECAETVYWLGLLHDTQLLSDAEFKAIMDDCLAIRKMLIATTKTLKKENLD
ncbi:MAG: four helix bundle protein [Kiritimatiellia bacterium]